MRNKVSYRQLYREAVKMHDESQGLKKELSGIINILFGFAVKLYKLSPDDKCFEQLKPEFLEKIKNASCDNNQKE